MDRELAATSGGVLRNKSGSALGTVMLGRSALAAFAVFAFFALFIVTLVSRKTCVLLSTIMLACVE
jgi:hypothetical protein